MHEPELKQPVRSRNVGDTDESRSAHDAHKISRVRPLRGNEHGGHGGHRAFLDAWSQPLSESTTNYSEDVMNGPESWQHSLTERTHQHPFVFRVPSVFKIPFISAAEAAETAEWHSAISGRRR